MQGTRAILIMAAVALNGCTAGAGNGAAPQVNAVRVEFRVEDASGHAATTFHGGDVVHFVFRVHNAGNASQTLEFTFPPHRVSVLSPAGAPVWRAFEGRVFPQVMRARDVPAGESITFTVEWEAGDAAPGIYRAQPEFIGFLQGAALERDLSAVPIHIE